MICECSVGLGLAHPIFLLNLLPCPVNTFLTVFISDCIPRFLALDLADLPEVISFKKFEPKSIKFEAIIFLNRVIAILENHPEPLIYDDFGGNIFISLLIPPPYNLSCLNNVQKSCSSAGV